LSGNTTSFDGYGNQAKPRTRFGENTFGNCITFTIDGQENFRLMYEKMLQAKNSIYIANYDLDPELRLIRGKGDPQSFQMSDFIVSPCLSESDNGNDKKKNTHNGEYYTLQNLLIEKAKQKVDIKIIVWEPRLIVRSFPLAKKLGLEGREKKVESMRELAKHYGIEDHITIRLDSKAPTLTSGFHEKIAIIDNQIGFCGGQDLSQDKWDTSDHDFDNSLRDHDGDPWHDVNAMIKGPIIWDLIFHFNQRWIYSLTKDIKQVKKAKINSSCSFLSSSLSSSAALAPFTNRGNEGNIEISALRTWKQLKGNIGDKDDNEDDGDSSSSSSSVRAWYDTMFRKAKHSIYIEDQFLFQDKIITQILVKRLEEEQDLKVITVGPMEPNLPGFFFSILSKESINDINNNLAALRKAGKNRVRTYCLISQHSTIKQKRKQIYVHSKIMITDDRWIIIGSANTDRDGFNDSTEFDLGITSTSLARQLRAKLWREHLKEYISSNNNININLKDFNKGFEAWDKVANDNGKRVQKGEAIQGHIYYYNFEEMNFPPPYTDAKGGNKFRFF
jgi:phosphatidylserine/phosphatidylglycerophosphate/cardiolipin synthase-like enzyme